MEPRITNVQTPRPNFSWTMGDGTLDVSFNFYEPKTLFNRFKWWLGTKICIPGSYKWDD